MKHVIRKAFFDYEKEEAWLNQMSARGLALTDYSWCRYVFEEAPPNQYIYRIELLENMPSHKDSVAYIKFLEENGIECVASHLNWIFLRKKSADGPFDVYTDIDSKIKHFQRINTMWSSLVFLEFAAGYIYIYTALVGKLNRTSLILGILLILLGLFFFGLGSRVSTKIRRLKQERLVRE
ncbi:MAG: DUF2812 domain-containing protein [Syntrophomonadaceae bacterium]|jgi:hypothetical protein